MLAIQMAVLLVLCSNAAGQTLQFFLVDRTIIESRMRAVPAKNDAREALVRSFFESAGCTGDQLREQPVKHEKVPNLVCAMAGDTERTIVVGAHSDHVSEGSGAVDNWSGVSLLPSLYVSLKSTQRRHTFVFVAFTAEEEGLVGSSFYVKDLRKEGLAKVSAMVDMDSLGMSSTKVGTSHTDQRLLIALSAVANSIHLPISAVNFDKVGLSDSGNFFAQHIPIIDFHSLTQDTFYILHSKQDQLSAIDMGAYYDSYHLIAAFLAYLDEVLDQPGQMPVK